jgi:hypothetical protein
VNKNAEKVIKLMDALMQSEAVNVPPEDKTEKMFTEARK